MKKGPALRPAVDRILARAIPEGECWRSTIGVQGNGYSAVGVGSTRKAMAHREVYEFFRAEIPPGLEIDHLCGMRACVNPWHMEPVTHAENLRRASDRLWANRSLCGRGHELASGDVLINKAGYRHCRHCYIENNRKSA